jgi:uncharacterized protein
VIQPRLVVSNTTPISNLIKIHHISLLHQVFDRVLIPAQVAEELDRGKHVLGAWREAPGANALDVERPLEGPFLHQLRLRLDEGEAAAIALAVERGASLLLMDEIDGRRAAQHHGLKIAGTLAILLEAKRQAFITEVRSLIDDLERVGFRMSNPLKEHVLSVAGEA